MVSLGTQPANRKSGFGHSSPTGARAQDLSRQPARPDLWGAGVGNDPGLPDPPRAAETACNETRPPVPHEARFGGGAPVFAPDPGYRHRGGCWGVVEPRQTRG